MNDLERIEAKVDQLSEDVAGVRKSICFLEGVIGRLIHTVRNTNVSETPRVHDEKIQEDGTVAGAEPPPHKPGSYS